MIISTDAEKDSDNIQHPFTINTLQKMGREGTNCNIIKTIYDKSTTNITVNGEKIRNKIQMPTLATFIQHSFGSSSHGNQRKKEIKGFKLEKKN